MPSAVISTKTEVRVAKRQKLDVGSEKITEPTTTQPSRIFAPFRTIGLVSPTSVPFTSIPLGKTTFQITTSVGQSLQTYDLRRGLALVFLSRPQTPYLITATTSWDGRVFAAWGSQNQDQDGGIWVFKRGKKVGELTRPDVVEPVKQLLIFGSWIVGSCSSRIEVWKSTTYEHYTTLKVASSTKLSGSEILTGAICHLPTYLNKIFAARGDGSVDIFNLSTGKRIYTILPPSSKAGSVTALQPAPALSLLAIAYAGGSLIIHNVRTDTTIMTLHSASSRRGMISTISFRTDGMGAGDDGRKAGVMATAGVESGDVTLWDLNDGGRVMGILRGAHQVPLDSTRTTGGGINRVEFLSGQPILVSSGRDNALKTWIFDETPFSAVPRILHSRSGHAASVTSLEFLPTDADGADAGGKWLLSAGQDRSLWGWSLRRDGQSTELSQGHIQKKAKKLGLLANNGDGQEVRATMEDLKAPAITCMASSLNRDGGMGASAGDRAIWINTRAGHSNRKVADATASGQTGWESVVTAHKGDKLARTWFWGRKRAGRWALETADGGEVRSVAITPCGTFALIGSSLGCIDMFNLQSGQHRRRFPAKLTPAQARDQQIREGQTGTMSSVATGDRLKFGRGYGKHVKAVTGLMVDSVNQTVVSCGLDGKVKFWDFLTGDLLHEVDWSLNTGILACRHHRSNDLIALSCSDLAIRVVDIETRKLARELWGCAGKINDFCFSNDGRWIVGASQDSLIRIWDLPTGHLIDVVRLQSVCTTLAFSGTGEYLATAHEAGVGVNIWTNRTIFTHVPTRNLTETDIARSTSVADFGESGRSTAMIEAAFADEPTEDIPLDESLSGLDQLSEDLMTLSLVPRSRWQTLLHLDVVKQRNKPKEPPKAPKKAPFFLPSLDSAKPLAPTEDDTSLAPLDRSRIMRIDRDQSGRPFTKLLLDGSTSGNYHSFIEMLKTLSPAAADLELRTLSPSNPSGDNELIVFVAALTSRLRQRQDYELLQAWMAVFLRLHGELVAQDEDLRAALREWKTEQESEAVRLGGLMGYCSSVVGFLRSGR